MTKTRNAPVLGISREFPNGLDAQGLRVFRQEFLKVTQRDLAHLLADVSPASISLWERGKASPIEEHQEMLRRLMRRYGIQRSLAALYPHRIPVRK